MNRLNLIFSTGFESGFDIPDRLVNIEERYKLSNHTDSNVKKK